MLSESSLSYVYAVGKQPSAMVDTRWKGMAGQTVKCGKCSRYAFCSLRIYVMVNIFDKDTFICCTYMPYKKKKNFRCVYVSK